jgi:hypothetical protein
MVGASEEWLPVAPPPGIALISITVPVIRSRTNTSFASLVSATPCTRSLALLMKT